MLNTDEFWAAFGNWLVAVFVALCGALWALSAWLGAD